MADQLNREERSILLVLARRAIESVVTNESLEPLDLKTLPVVLQESGVTFVTLTKDEVLRGCVGALEAYQPLAEDVREHAIAAATQDYRFPPVQVDELQAIQIEISRLTHPVPLDYSNPGELASRLQPGIDGVVIREGLQRATFLPQVWEKLPNPVDFLDHLCIKMGADASYWRYKMLNVLTYQVEEFRE